MNYSCTSEVKSGEIIKEEYENLINEIKRYKHHLDKDQNILCFSCEYGKVLWKSTVHKSSARN